MTGPQLLGVAGLGGGAGTSTVTLAIAGLLAWAGRQVIVAGDEDLLRLCGHAGWQGPGTPELATLDPGEAAAEAALLLRPVGGVNGLAVIGGGPAGEVVGWPADVVVVDQRLDVTPETAVLVARADGCLRAGAGGGQPVLVVGDGVLDRSGVRRRLGRPPAGWLPADARVARAGLAGRVPAALPGRWLAGLRAALVRPTRSMVDLSQI